MHNVNAVNPDVPILASYTSMQHNEGKEKRRYIECGMIEGKLRSRMRSAVSNQRRAKNRRILKGEGRAGAKELSESKRSLSASGMLTLLEKKRSVADHVQQPWGGI